MMLGVPFLRPRVFGEPLALAILFHFTLDQGHYGLIVGRDYTGRRRLICRSGALQ
jgi:hypothetical protein